MDKPMLSLISEAYAWWLGKDNPYEAHEYVCDAIGNRGYRDTPALVAAAHQEVRGYLGEFKSCHHKAGFTGYMLDSKEEPAVLAEREKLWNHLLIWAREYDAQHST